MFLISPENVQKLREEVIADPDAKGTITFISDIVQAFFWRSAIKSRYGVAKELRGETFRSDEISVPDLPVDGRLYFSSLLPSSYMSSLLIPNRPNMPICGTLLAGDQYWAYRVSHPRGHREYHTLPCTWYFYASAVLARL